MSTPIESLRPLIRTRQYREFTTEPVGDDALRALAQVARWTGSGNNWQPWRLVVVRDLDVIRQLAVIGMPQTRSLHTATAAIALAMPNDPDKRVMSAYDEGRLSERVLVAATLLGIGAGIAWVRDQFRPQVHELLDVPEDRFVRTIIAVGHPTDAARLPRSAPGEARLPLAEIVIWL